MIIKWLPKIGYNLQRKYIIIKLPKQVTSYKKQKCTDLSNLKQKKTDKTKQILNELIEESNRLRHIRRERQLQLCINLIHMGIG